MSGSAWEGEGIFGYTCGGWMLVGGRRRGVFVGGGEGDETEVGAGNTFYAHVRTK